MFDNYAETVPCKRWHAISILFANDPSLLNFLFTPSRDELSSSPEDLLCWSGALSSGQQILIKIALDIWSGAAQASLEEILATLDSYRFENFLLALEFYRYGRRVSRMPVNNNYK